MVRVVVDEIVIWGSGCGYWADGMGDSEWGQWSGVVNGGSRWGNGQWVKTSPLTWTSKSCLHQSSCVHNNYNELLFYCQKNKIIGLSAINSRIGLGSGV